MHTQLIKNDKKVINAWCMYDWANSVYSLTITTAVFPSYFYEITGGKDAIIPFLGIEVKNTVLYTYTLSFAFLLVALLNPILSAISDYSGNKPLFMKFFTYLGAFSCAMLYFFDSSEMVVLGVFSFGFAAIGYAGSLVFYNSFLPEIATEDQFDSISAKGFSLGYIGSVLLLIINLTMILNPSIFGISVNENGKAIDGTLAPRISFLLVGLWWAGFSLITFAKLPANVFGRKPKGNILIKGYKELQLVWKQAQNLPNLKRFLVAFACFSLGVQTIMYLATIYGEEVVNMKMDELIVLVLLIQLVAILGSYFFSYLSSKRGNINALLISLLIWIGIAITAFFITEGMKTTYYILGIFVGMVMGGVQSLSRSTYSKLIPEDTIDNASYFSFFETIEKASIALGTFVYVLILQLTGKMNYSALVLSVFFIVGAILLKSVKINTSKSISK